MKLYVCSTYYHALIACVKQLVDRQEADILITEYIPEGAALARRIEESGLFRRTVYIGGVEEYVFSNAIDHALFYHRKSAAAIERSFPAGFRFEDYDEVNIFHDGTWMAHYMKDRRLPYRIVEDALDSYKILTTGPFAHMLPQKGLKQLIKRLFHIGYLYFGEDGLVREIEVNDLDGVELPRERLVEVPRKPLFDALRAEAAGPGKDGAGADPAIRGRRANGHRGGAAGRLPGYREGAESAGICGDAQAPSPGRGGLFRHGGSRP